METYIAALDQGTTSSRAILFNRAGEIVSAPSILSGRYIPVPDGWSMTRWSFGTWRKKSWRRR